MKIIADKLCAAAFPTSGRLPAAFPLPYMGGESHAASVYMGGERRVGDRRSGMGHAASAIRTTRKRLGSKLMALLLSLACVLTAQAQVPVKRQLQSLFDQAERCYLMDDYEGLQHLIRQYTRTMEQGVPDSADVFQAYLDKMRGSYYYGQNDSCRQAESCYWRSLGVFRSLTPVYSVWAMHPNEVVLHQELAQLYYKLRRYADAQAQLDTLLTYYDAKRHLPTTAPHYFATLSQLAMCNARQQRFDEALRQIDEAMQFYNDNSDGIAAADYEEMLRKRGKILMMKADAQGDTDYADAKRCYEQYVCGQYATIGQRLQGMTPSQRSQYWLANHRFLYDCCRLGQRAPAMLYDLALFSKDYLITFERDSLAPRCTWQQVMSALGKNDCAIEFVQYFARNDQKRMGCLVLTPDSSEPQFIDLFSTDSVLNIRFFNNESLEQYITLTGGPWQGVAYAKKKIYENETLASLFWSPRLLAAIGKARNVYFAPDGLLNVVAIEYMMPDKKKTCYRLSSTRNIVRRRAQPTLASALLCGAIPYSADVQQRQDGNDEEAYRHLANHKLSVKDLKGSKREVVAVHQLRQCRQDTLFTGPQATDDNFLQLMRRHYDMVVVSTHGYYRGDIGLGTDIKPQLSDLPMSRSGLLFSGVNLTLADEHFDSQLSDGILSAAEICRQDFGSTQLLILSACETGLGRLTDDGVCGLVRGLKQAGVGAVLLSLWEVNDSTSSMLIYFFQKELQRQKRKDIRGAFLRARQQLASNKTFNTPYHTCPFILIDALRPE